jgi:hypothetical protein
MLAKVHNKAWLAMGLLCSTLGGLAVYIRFAWGSLTLGIGA